jgi:hypothetical protein
MVRRRDVVVSSSSVFVRISLAAAALLALSAPRAARADDSSSGVWAGCMDGKQYDTGLCYERCASGTTGVGPVCWGACAEGFTDEGALCAQNAVITAKSSYGRGAGNAMTCAASEEQNGALCYPRCAAGYYGVGPVCWQSCPDGFTDDGVTCRKNGSIIGANNGRCPWYDKCGLTFARGCSTCPEGYANDGCTCRINPQIFAKGTYGRGAGRPLDACPSGLEQSGALCYPPCAAGYSGVGPVCWSACPAGFHDDGATCRKDAVVVPKPSYGRGAGTVPPILSSHSFSNPLPPVGSTAPFTMLFASDTQLPWWTDHAPACTDDACVLAHGLDTNRRQIAAMRAIQRITSVDPKGTAGVWPAGHVTRDGGAAITRPRGVVINGDLTAYFHQWQTDLFENLYVDPASFDLPLFPGLGNHDFANNVRDCYSTRTPSRLLDHNGCAKDAVDFIKATMFGDKVPTFPIGSVQSFDNGSLAYSWNFGAWHFVQLHNYPTYAQPDLGVSSAIAWLTADLSAATAAGRRSVIDFHDYGDHLKQDDPAFLGAIQGQRVAAIFAGHIHSDAGLVGYAPGGAIPVFRSGASEYETFLLVEFGDSYMNVGVVDSGVSPPRFIDPYNPAMLATYAVP